MVELALPKNSKIGKGRHFPAPATRAAPVCGAIRDHHFILARTAVQAVQADLFWP